jgi:hypothetical protein
MKPASAALLLLWTLAGSAFGQAYECRTPSGNIVRQYGTPCAPGMDTRSPPREAAKRAELERESQQVQKARELEAAVLRREIVLGMSSDQVLRVWGDPGRRETEESAGGVKEAWRWWCGRSRVLYNEIVFQKDRVTEIKRSC